MKVIEITSTWAVVADHIVDVWLSGDDNETLNISYDIPKSWEDSTTFSSEDEAKRAFARIVAELRGVESFMLED